MSVGTACVNSKVCNNGAGRAGGLVELVAGLKAFVELSHVCFIAEIFGPRVCSVQFYRPNKNAAPSLHPSMIGGYFAEGVGCAAR